MISDLVLVPAHGAPLTGDLVVPGPVRSIVVITEGGSSSRTSSRDRAIAAAFHRAALGTLLLDLLTEREKREDAGSARHRFEAPFLARRLVDAIDWLEQRPETSDLPVCLFGTDTAAAAVLVAAAERPRRVSAVVSQSERPDLAHDALDRIQAPVLFIVVGDDETQTRLGEGAAGTLKAPHRIHVVREAAHPLQESRILEEVTTAAVDWFASRGSGRH